MFLCVCAAEDDAPEDEEEPPEGLAGHVVRAWRRVRGRTWCVAGECVWLLVCASLVASSQL